MSIPSNILDQAIKTQVDYYKNNPKNTIFKGSQKNMCANYVSDNMNLPKMIRYTAMIIPNTNIIYYNYLLFKTYGNEHSSQILMSHVVDLANTLLQKYSNFEFHVNLKSFSISACQRYFPYISSIFGSNDFFIKKTSKIVVYHTPNVIQQITCILYPIIGEHISIVEYVYKDSDTRIQKLFD